MNFIHFSGNKKTSEELLNKVKSVSENAHVLMNNLKSLNIFDECTQTKNNVHLNETANTVKMRCSSKGKQNIAIKFPNILGNGEFFSLDYQGLKDFTAQVGMPVFLKNQIFIPKVIFNREKKEINDKTIEIKKVETCAKFNNFSMKLGVEKVQKLSNFYNQFNFRFLGCKIDTKVGYSNSDKVIPFCKIIGEKKLSVKGDNLFLESSLKLGKIFGQTTILEKFFLGSNLHGYQKSSIGPVNQNQKIGGNTFLELKNRIGLYYKKFELFAFGDVGVNTVKGIKECGEILVNFGDNNCIGKSVGIGLGMKNKKGPTFVFAIPLTSNQEAERFSLGVDFEF